VTRLQGGQPSAVFYTFGHPTPHAYATFCLAVSVSVNDANFLFQIIERSSGIHGMRYASQRPGVARRTWTRMFRKGQDFRIVTICRMSKFIFDKFIFVEIFGWSLIPLSLISQLLSQYTFFGIEVVKFESDVYAVVFRQVTRQVVQSRESLVVNSEIRGTMLENNVPNS
jgi:hypothetical protein